MIVATLGGNILNLELTHMSTYRKMIKPVVVYLYSVVIDSLENSGAIVITLNNTDQSYHCNADQKEPNIKGCMW